MSATKRPEAETEYYLNTDQRQQLFNQLIGFIDDEKYVPHIVDGIDSACEYYSLQKQHEEPPEDQTKLIKALRIVLNSLYVTPGYPITRKPDETRLSWYLEDILARQQEFIEYDGRTHSRPMVHRHFLIRNIWNALPEEKRKKWPGSPAFKTISMVLNFVGEPPPADEYYDAIINALN